MRLLHGLAKICATFDDPNLVSREGVVPVMALAQRGGPGQPGRRACPDRSPVRGERPGESGLPGCRDDRRGGQHR